MSLLRTGGNKLTGQARRRWVTSVIVAVAVIAALVLVAGCGGGDEGDTAGTDDGTPTVCVYSQPWQFFSSQDPGKEYWNSMYHYQVYETLCDQDLENPQLVKPRLAESWESSEDGKVWTFKLRQGVKFHGGGEMTAEDVVFSYERNRELAAGPYNFVLGDFWGGIKAIDDYTVEITLTQPAPMAAISLSESNTYIYSKAAFEKDGEKAFEPGTETAGTGPYVPQSLTTNEVTYNAFPDYWGGWDGDHSKAPDIVVMRRVDEAATRIQQLQTGDAQIVGGIPVRSCEDLKNDPNVNFMTGQWWRQAFGFINTKSGPTKDIHLREAMFYAFPYEQVQEVAFQGMSTIPTGPISPPGAGYEAQKELLGLCAQDMDKAKAALAKSAYPDGDVKLLCYVDTGMQDNMQAAQLYKQALNELNIELDVRYIASDVAYTQALDKNPPQALYIVEWTAFYPGFANYALMKLLSDSAYNLTYWQDPKVDDLCYQALAAEATDTTKSAELCAQAEQQARKGFPYLWVADAEWRAATAKNVTWKGYPTFSAYMIHFYDDVEMN